MRKAAIARLVRTLATGASALAAGLIPRGADAALETTDRAAFDAAVLIQTTEDWEDINIGDGGVMGCPAPADSTSSSACFDPGDIVPGMTWFDSPGPDTAGLAAVGAGFSGNSSRLLCTNTFTDTTIIEFSPPVDAFGGDLHTFTASASVTITVLSPASDVPILVTTASGTLEDGSFWGYVADAPISRIELFTASNQVECFDDIGFGHVCGNGRVSGDEDCDDGNTVDDETCPADCRLMGAGGAGGGAGEGGAAGEGGGAGDSSTGGTGGDGSGGSGTGGDGSGGTGTGGDGSGGSSTGGSSTGGSSTGGSGTGGSGSGTGGSETGGGSGTAGSAAGGAAGGASDDGGCGCSIPGAASSFWPAVGALFGFVALRRRRRLGRRLEAAGRGACGA